MAGVDVQLNYVSGCPMSFEQIRDRIALDAAWAALVQVEGWERLSDDEIAAALASCMRGAVTRQRIYQVYQSGMAKLMRKGLTLAKMRGLALELERARHERECVETLRRRLHTGRNSEKTGSQDNMARVLEESEAA